MVRAGDQTHHMRCHKAHKSNGSSDRYTYTDQDRYGDQYDEFRLTYIDADRTSIGFSDRKSIEFSGKSKKNGPADQQNGEEYQGVQIA